MKSMINLLASKLTVALATGGLFLGVTCESQAQGRSKGKNAARDGSKLNLGANPTSVGSKGIMWYATWDSAKAEAKRSGRPIFFMTAAYQCSNVPGVY